LTDSTEGYDSHFYNRAKTVKRYAAQNAQINSLVLTHGNLLTYLEHSLLNFGEQCKNVCRLNIEITQIDCYLKKSS